MVERKLKNKVCSFTHIDKKGKAMMVNVGDKKIQKRYASAQGRILLAAKTISLIKANQLKKGDVLTVAQLAGIQAAKETSRLIPLCHLLNLDNVELKLELVDEGVMATSKVHCLGRTGVEMEALTAVSLALLTVYDMCKAVDKNMRLTDIYLVEKVKNDVE